VPSHGALRDSKKGHLVQGIFSKIFLQIMKYFHDHKERKILNKKIDKIADHSTGKFFLKIIKL